MLRSELENKFKIKIWCDDGWLELIQSTLYLIDPYINRIRQVKEKFGELRIYVDLEPQERPGLDEWINSVLTLAQIRSRQICEITGKPGEVRKDPSFSDKDYVWLKCLSDEEYERRRLGGIRIASSS